VLEPLETDQSPEEHVAVIWAEMSDVEEPGDEFEEFDEEDFDDEFDDDFEEELEDEIDADDLEVTEEDLADVDIDEADLGELDDDEDGFGAAPAPGGDDEEVEETEE
jgi:hypothetical protein